MARMTVRELDLLLQPHEPPCISIGLPTHRFPDSKQDPIRYRKLLERADGLLHERGVRDTRLLIDPLRRLAEDEFWNNQHLGLAVFRSVDVLAHFELPIEVTELVVVDDTFYIKPIVQYLYWNRFFGLLVLGGMRARLYEGTPFALFEVRLHETRRAPEEEVGAEPVLLAESVRAIQELSTSVQRQLANVPLLLAGEAHLVQLFRQLSDYPALLEASLVGSFEHESAEQLHVRAWPVVAAHLLNEETRILNLFAEAKAHGRAADGIDTVARNILRGRVRWLLLAEGRRLPGRVDRESGLVSRSSKDLELERADLLDELAEMALLRGSEVVVVAPERMPTPSPIAAIYRY